MYTVFSYDESVILARCSLLALINLGCWFGLSNLNSPSFDLTHIIEKAGIHVALFLSGL